MRLLCLDCGTAASPSGCAMRWPPDLRALAPQAAWTGAGRAPTSKATLPRLCVDGEKPSREACSRHPFSVAPT
jgi:hypothetical protein